MVCSRSLLLAALAFLGEGHQAVLVNNFLINLSSSELGCSSNTESKDL